MSKPKHIDSKIFISISSDEIELGNKFSDAIDDIFCGQIKCSLFNINPGDEWKKKVKKNLNECNILVSFLTPHFIKRPWAYVEWSSFWFATKRKHIFLLLTEDNKNISSLFEPFNDIQATYIYREDSVRLFLNKLKEITKINAPEINLKGNQLCNELVTTYQKIIEQRNSNEYDQFKNTTILPNDDEIVKNIVLYFYNISDINTFIIKFKQIFNEETKYQIAKYLLIKDDFLTFNKIISFIESSEKLTTLYRYLQFQKGHSDSDTIRLILQQICTLSQGQITIICKDLAFRNLEHTTLFKYLLEMLDNDVEKRKLIIYIYCNSNLATKENLILSILNLIISDVEKRNLAIYCYNNDPKGNLIKPIINTINGDVDKRNVINYIYNKDSNDDIIKYVLHTMNGDVDKRNIINYIYNSNPQDSLIKYILQTMNGDVDKRKIIIYIYNKNPQDDLIKYIIQNMNGDVDKRKVITYLYEKSPQDDLIMFIINNINGDADKRQTIMYIYTKNTQDNLINDIFQTIVGDVEKRNLALLFCINSDKIHYLLAVKRINSSGEAFGLFRNIFYKGIVEDFYYEIILNQINSTSTFEDIIKFMKDSNMPENITKLIIERKKIISSL